MVGDVGAHAAPPRQEIKRHCETFACCHAATVPSVIDDYLTSLVQRTRDLADTVVGFYAVGSLATGDAQPTRSDVDVMVVVSRPLGGSRRRLADAVVEEGLRCPWAGVEYVVYDAEAVSAPRYPLAYELNVSAGPARAVHVALGGDPAHWFLLDVAMARDHAIALYGPPADALLGEPPLRDVAQAISDALTWHAHHEVTSADAVLNACRSWCYLVTGRWASKSDAGAWALHQDADAALVREALRARAGNVVALDPRRVRGLLASVGRLAAEQR